eukprot:scaffold104137_cov87-Phaeocystis_antarctica.AAC.1
MPVWWSDSRSVAAARRHAERGLSKKTSPSPGASARSGTDHSAEQAGSLWVAHATLRFMAAIVFSAHGCPPKICAAPCRG